MPKRSLWCSFLNQIRGLWSYEWGMLWATHTNISNFQSSTIANTLKPQPDKSDAGAFIGMLWGGCDWPSPIQMSETGCLTKYTFSLIHIGYSFFPLWVLLCALCSPKVKYSADFLVFFQTSLIRSLTDLGNTCTNMTVCSRGAALEMELNHVLCSQV